MRSRICITATMRNTRYSCITTAARHLRAHHVQHLTLAYAYTCVLVAQLLNITKLHVRICEATRIQENRSELFRRPSRRLSCAA